MATKKQSDKSEAPAKQPEVKPFEKEAQVEFNGLRCKVAAVIPDKRVGWSYRLTTPNGATVHSVLHKNLKAI